MPTSASNSRHAPLADAGSRMPDAGYWNGCRLPVKAAPSVFTSIRHPASGIRHPVSSGIRRAAGSALLTVLWISAALAAIAVSLASTVRGETERTSTAIDDLRSYYLATGAIDRAMLEVLWSALNPDQRLLTRGVTSVDYRFPTGAAHVEIIPEAAKLDINTAAPDKLFRLLEALGVEPARAQEIALGIVDWRTPGDGLFDAYYLSLTPSFRASHASFQETEELLQVRGVTPEIYYGTYLPETGHRDLASGLSDGRAPEAGPRLIHRSGLIDCVTTFGSGDRVDANTANPAVLVAIGLPPEAVNLLVERRRAAPIDDHQLSELAPLLGAGAAFLRLEGNSIINYRATARVLLPNGQLSDLKRTVAAQVKYMPTGYDSRIHILRWYDTAWSN
jgi:general secretion pathway protein K